MACGFGACFGCAVRLRRGDYVRLCVDGPVMRAEELEAISCVSVEFCGLALAHPILNGSGTFDVLAARRVFGEELERQFPFSAFVSKTITLEPRLGNPPPRLWEAPSGLINSIGLPNPGLEAYLERDLPQLAKLPVPLITNVMGSSAADLHAPAWRRATPARRSPRWSATSPVRTSRRALTSARIPPTGAMWWPRSAPRTSKPLIVKLTPNTADVGACASAAEAGGADAVSLINTLRAMGLSPGAQNGGPWLGAGTGGLSGPAIRAVALAQVAAVAERVRIPVVGMGGVQSARHARELLSVGATLVGVGTRASVIRRWPHASPGSSPRTHRRRESHRRKIPAKRLATIQEPRCVSTST